METFFVIFAIFVISFVIWLCYREQKDIWKKRQEHEIRDKLKVDALQRIAARIEKYFDISNLPDCDNCPYDIRKD